MLAKLQSMGVFGIDAFPVEVEVCVTRAAMPRSTIVGLPDASVKESIDRVRAALRSTGHLLPPSAITVNLAPADRRKEGPAFELPIALGLLSAIDSVKLTSTEAYAVVGELALDGRVRAVNGCLSMALQARAQGFRGMVVPVDNAREAGVVRGLDVIPVNHLAEAVGFLSGAQALQPVRTDVDRVFSDGPSYDVDLAEVQGQHHARRALEVAAAGGHNMLMIGPPGAGKSMLAQRLCTILPPLTLEESLETTRVYSICGLLRPGTSLMTVRPFRAPHHGVSNAGLVGGGTHPRPGEISLAHHGVLFLDELPEFALSALEALRQPLENGTVTIARVQMTIAYPAQFMLVAAMNPCPCGHYTDPRRQCRCTPRQVHNYRRRLSGPLLDRIDIHVDVPPLEYRELAAARPGEPSAAVRARVVAARRIQIERFAGDGVYANAQMPRRQVRAHCALDDDGRLLLRQAMETLGLSARAYDKILKVARTIADLEASDRILPQHVSEAINYRTLDRRLE
ncbi:MAG: YifB family Mg chelatase-like AAA ATPase [Candidatus Brocadiaceae bacterium]|nr:YifB family Mg chelatase-like AAA ATPase [Candidatus Brocadiaceae bacterium]